MLISTAMQQAIALFWTLSSLAGFLVTTPMLLTAFVVWRRLKAEGVEYAMTVMTQSHVEGDALRLAMHLSFFILGTVRLLASPPPPPVSVPDPLLYWVGVVVLMLVPIELITVSLRSHAARQKAARDRIAVI